MVQWLRLYPSSVGDTSLILSPGSSTFLGVWSEINSDFLLESDWFQCCVSFRCTAKWVSGAHVHSFLESFPIQAVAEHWVEESLFLLSTECCPTVFMYHSLFILKIILFIYLSLALLGWVFVIVCGLSLVVESRAYSLVVVWASHCSGFSCCRAQALGAMGFSTCNTSTEVITALGL